MLYSQGLRTIAVSSSLPGPLLQRQERIQNMAGGKRLVKMYTRKNAFAGLYPLPQHHHYSYEQLFPYKVSVTNRFTSNHEVYTEIPAHSP